MCFDYEIVLYAFFHNKICSLDQLPIFNSQAANLILISVAVFLFIVNNVPSNQHYCQNKVSRVTTHFSWSVLTYPHQL